MDRKLLEAVYSGDADFIRGAAQLQPNDLLEVTVGGNSVLHIAAKLGHLDVASLVCDLQPSLLKMCNLSGDTPLHCAAAAGLFEIVKLFLRHAEMLHPEEPCLRMKNRTAGNTALHGATMNSHDAVVELLMETDHELAAMVNNAGVSALYMAAERGSVEIARILLQYPMTSHQGPHGQVALHAAVFREDYELTKMILQKRIDHLSYRDSSGSTPLHFAAAKGDLRMVQMLLQHDASIAYLQDQEGFSAIHVAASVGRTKIVNEILLHCPDSMEQKIDKGWNFLHTAIEKKNLEMVKYVLKLKTTLLKELVNEQDDEGNTPLHLAVTSQHKKIIRALLSSRIVDASVMNNSGQTPVDLASSNAKTAIGFRIYLDLRLHGSRFSPQRVDCRRNNSNSMRKKDEEINRHRALVEKLGIIAALIATVTFAAAFTLPGGYKNDSGIDAGLAVLSSRASFKAFLITDTLAMASSITVTVMLIYSSSIDPDLRFRSLLIAGRLLTVAIICMTLAFAAAVYVSLAHDCQWVAILVCVTAYGVPCVTLIIINYPGTEFLSKEEVLLRPHKWMAIFWNDILVCDKSN